MKLTILCMHVSILIVESDSFNDSFITVYAVRSYLVLASFFSFLEELILEKKKNHHLAPECRRNGSFHSEASCQVLHEIWGGDRQT